MANSTRKCKQCAEYKPAESGVKTPVAWFCCNVCAIEFARAKSARNFEIEQRRRSADAKRSRNAARNALRQRGLLVKPLSYWMKRAQAAFNSWVRARDARQPCISCGRHHDGQYHAGHYRPAGSNPELRFEPDNCHKQCAPCNSHLSGNLTKYRQVLIAKVGLERVEWLDGPHEPKRYRREDYQAIEAEYKAKLKEINGS